MTQGIPLHRLSATAILAFIIVSGATTVCSAQQTSAIGGRVYIAGRHPINPAAGEARNTHAYLTIRGEGAVRMYRAMSGVAEDDVCRGNGWKIKRAGDFACSLLGDGKKAECDFAVELQQGAIAPGNPC